LDNCFTGWDGIAEVEAGQAGLRVEASKAFASLLVFTPSRADFFCVEPVSHIPDAVNRGDLAAGQAMASLSAGDSLTGTIRFISIG
jgi:aldose 1-epimerase